MPTAFLYLIGDVILIMMITILLFPKIQGFIYLMDNIEEQDCLAIMNRKNDELKDVNFQ